VRVAHLDEVDLARVRVRARARARVRVRVRVRVLARSASVPATLSRTVSTE
jgi:hypothetical protein